MSTTTWTNKQTDTALMALCNAWMCKWQNNML